jgi:microcompartment protein CcmK/EutM
MLLGKVVGTVVCDQRVHTMTGSKFLIVEKVDYKGVPCGGYEVAVDAVGAGTNEVVLYTVESSARQTGITKDRPVDAVIVGIVDTVELSGEAKFQKVPVWQAPPVSF